ncbi:DNA breaking-rejoining enzyme [Boletus edulis BED1]|uniref:DNA breaking-rejoining enzyme n=1 Tax=Boletus edulis BED1 TaxID=1328754 RepID=A0AAD4G609_BOLED|nr:DNA breaking-rejoining enzyme [Boletus edulis BED1]
MAGVNIVTAAAQFWTDVTPQQNPTRPAVIASLHTTTTTRPLRAPRSSSQILPSPLRPHVAAADRLLMWTTPAGHSWQRDLEDKLPNPTIFKLFQVMIYSLDKDTRSNYGSGLLRFTQFCDNINIPENDRMPASQELIAAFAASHAGRASDKTLNNWLAGLHFWHTVNGVPWHGSDMLRSVRRGFAKLVPATSRRAKRPPVTIEALTLLHDNLDANSPFDCAVAAAAFTAFWSCCRLGELLPRSSTDFSLSKHVTRSILPFITKRLPDGTTFLSFHIPWTKTTQEKGADISVTARPHCTDPLSALISHEHINNNLPAHAPLFAYRSGAGWSPLTKINFIAWCNDIWASLGLPRMPGHAFRIGGTTEMLLEGINPDIIAVQGRWSSRAFLEYWRRIETVLPLFISSSTDTARLQTLDSIMSGFAKRHTLLHV